MPLSSDERGGRLASVGAIREDDNEPWELTVCPASTDSRAASRRTRPRSSPRPTWGWPPRSPTWVKLGTDSTESTDSSTASLADSFSPEKMFGSTLSGSAAAGYKAVGEEQKNGVGAVHYARTRPFSARMAHVRGRRQRHLVGRCVGRQGRRVSGLNVGPRHRRHRLARHVAREARQRPDGITAHHRTPAARGRRIPLA